MKTDNFWKALFDKVTAKTLAEREKEIMDVLKEDSISLAIYLNTIYKNGKKNGSINLKFKNAYDLSNLHTATDRLFNRHDIFHAITTLFYACKIAKIISKPNCTYCSYISNDEDFLKIITLSCLWHDATRALTDQSDHGVYTPWLQDRMLEIVAPLIADNTITDKIIMKSLYCIEQHDKENKCKHFDAALVRIGDGLDCDKFRSGITKEYKFKDLLKEKQLTHVWGTYIIEKIDISPYALNKRPVKITVHIRGNIRDWKKYNWFQVQEVLVKKIESTGEFKKLFMLEIICNGEYLDTYYFP